MIKILAADDEILALEMLVEAIKDAEKNAEVKDFTKPSQLLEYAKENKSDIAFLDIHMRGMNGVELAKKLKELNPKINIIFVTSYDQYTANALQLRASGYIMKPVTSDRVKEELENLRYPLLPEKSSKLRIQCFGNFDVFDKDGKPVHFERKRSKEVLAYLVYKNGGSCTIKEIAAALFEDEPYDKKQQDYIQKIISALVKSLKAVDAKNAINKSYNSISVNKDEIDCDYYNFKELDVRAINSYYGEFMSQYSWADFMI